MKIKAILECLLLCLTAALLATVIATHGHLTRMTIDAAVTAVVQSLITLVAYLNRTIARLDNAGSGKDG